jgi:hypothetical protein
MPTTRRKIRRRHSAADELKAWSCTFECGRNYFWELRDLLGGDPGDAVNSPEVRRAAEEAWHRLGSRFMAQRDGSKEYLEHPWALTEFGEP